MAAPEHDDIAQGLFFIVGTGRCGSTLLQAMLSRHPQLGLPPETKFFQEWDPALRASDPLADEGSLRRHIAWARRLWFWQDLALDEERLIRDALAGGRSARALFLGVMAQWCERLGKPRLGEKTPGHHKHVERILELFPRAKIIHIHRDPRDVVASIVKLRWGGHSSARRHARTWAKAVRRQRLLAEQLGPDRHHTVRFESLVLEPEATLRRVCDFLGEAFDPAMLRFHERQETGFSPREAPWKGDTLKPLDPSAIGKGLGALSPRQLSAVERVCAAEMVRLGYEPVSGKARLSWLAADALEEARWAARRLGRSALRRLGVDLRSRDEAARQRRRRRDAVGDSAASVAAAVEAPCST